MVRLFNAGTLCSYRLSDTPANATACNTKSIRTEFDMPKSRDEARAKPRPDRGELEQLQGHLSGNAPSVDIVRIACAAATQSVEALP